MFTNAASPLPAAAGSAAGGTGARRLALQVYVTTGGEHPRRSTDLLRRTPTNGRLTLYADASTTLVTLLAQVHAQRPDLANRAATWRLYPQVGMPSPPILGCTPKSLQDLSVRATDLLSLAVAELEPGPMAIDAPADAPTAMDVDPPTLPASPTPPSIFSSSAFGTPPFFTASMPGLPGMPDFASMLSARPAAPSIAQALSPLSAALSTALPSSALPTPARPLAPGIKLKIKDAPPPPTSRPERPTDLRAPPPPQQPLSAPRPASPTLPVARTASPPRRMYEPAPPPIHDRVKAALHAPPPPPIHDRVQLAHHALPPPPPIHDQMDAARRLPANPLAHHGPAVPHAPPMPVAAAAVPAPPVDVFPTPDPATAEWFAIETDWRNEVVEWGIDPRVHPMAKVVAQKCKEIAERHRSGGGARGPRGEIDRSRQDRERERPVEGFMTGTMGTIRAMTAGMDTVQGGGMNADTGAENTAMTVRVGAVGTAMSAGLQAAAAVVTVVIMTGGTEVSSWLPASPPGVM